MSNVPSARLVLFKDLKNYREGDSVRITGLWEVYDESKNTATLRYNDVEAIINLSQVDQIIAQKGDLVQCIGEIMEVANGSTVLQARIIRCVNTIDMELYEKVVELRNKVI
ncbi:telomere-capping, CST complex subunit-domain-containing protein [Parasitella parasitica]|nr:telomere-capping, CST complex subunit-domain-containing protein [Parasitella parasitica]